MPIISIITQPASNDLKAAYRPVVLRVSATRTDGNATPPLVYCDIYVNGIFYKSMPRTQYALLNPSDSEWQFDIQDACQEILSQMIASNGGSSIVQAPTLIASVYCKFRSSGYDVNGFLTSEGTAPIQGTGTTAPTAGTGTQSNTFFVAMSALQHEQNQDLPSHLNYFKNGTWASNVYPLTHRPNEYKVCAGDSDYFPIVNLGSSDPLCLKLYYKYNSADGYSSASMCGEVPCTGVSIPAFAFSDAISGTAYSKSITIVGTTPLTLSIIAKPAWMSIDLTGNTLTFSGTPGGGDIASAVPVNFSITNACGSDAAYKSINVVSSCTAVAIVGTPDLPNAYTGIAYEYDITLSGTAPFSVGSFSGPAWMSASITDNILKLTGTPATGDVGTAISVAVTITNACGSVDFSDTLNVIQSGVRFGSPSGGSGDALNYTETANITGGVAGATLTIKCTTYINSNGGTLKINTMLVSGTSFTFNVVLDGSGNGSFVSAIAGLNHPSSAIEGIFTITSTTSGTIGTPDTYETSKAF